MNLWAFIDALFAAFLSVLDNSASTITASAPETSAVLMQKPMLTGYAAPAKSHINPPASILSSRSRVGSLPTSARISGTPSELSRDILHMSLSEPLMIRIPLSLTIVMIFASCSLFAPLLTSTSRISSFSLRDAKTSVIPHLCIIHVAPIVFLSRLLH